MKDLLRIFGKTGKVEHEDILGDAFRNKYNSFQSLLAKNNQVLELMADMEEKATGQYLFDRAYISRRVDEVSEGVLKIIEHLNELAPDKYRALYEVHEAIQRRIRESLTTAITIPVSDYVLPLSQLAGNMADVAGGKIAHLGEIRNRLGIPTPDGFVVSTSAFKRFMDHNHIREKVNELLSGLDVQNLKEVIQASEKIQKMIADAEFPADVYESILRASNDLWNRLGEKRTVAVRSSAVSEDGKFSFAGQYATFLNVEPESVHQKYKEVLASLFTQRSIFYYKAKGFSEDEMVMAVGVLEMIKARSGGVLYTQDPNGAERDVMILNSAWGLTKSVVDGVVHPDMFVVSRVSGDILERKVSTKTVRAVADEGGGITEYEVDGSDRDLPSLSDAQIRQLHQCATKIEAHYGKPQDIEWALSPEGDIMILQSRPLRVVEQKERRAIPPRLDTYRILIDRGVIACRGVGYGRAVHVRNDQDLLNFPEKGVLVARQTSTKFVTVMDKAAAIITDVGGVTGHMASLAREFGIPTILDTETATRTIKEGQEITVDAINCNIYDGRVEELIAYAERKAEPLKETPLLRMFDRVLGHIVSLRLVDPSGDNFNPQGCTTYHDITRFAHEKAMTEMFGLSDTSEVSSDHTVALKVGIPLDAHLLDVGNGVTQGVKKADTHDILSIPFRAFVRGLKAMRWPEPRPADVKGFMGMMAHTATIPEEQLRGTAEKSFAIISSHYMNFSIRLGYHFSMVEAFAGDNRNDNYIKFFFKGGGASRDRRLRRVRLISEIIARLDFNVKVVEDVVDAVLLKFKKEDIEARLEGLGRLTVFTKQLDMAMFNDAITDSYREDFVKSHLATVPGLLQEGEA